ncbi:MAG: selenium-binding protein [Rickettsiales bacterium]|nr:selenium-binding protein [Rickettsiales bacterium]|tara:strand:+ start:6860 stop:8224 length:1365 start_codon:yes stop_codon:yes gene_type:complete
MSNEDNCCLGPGYASPLEAIKAPKEKLVYTICIYTGSDIKKPDYLATIDVHTKSPSYGKVIHRTELGEFGDELHHMGWNACSSCHNDNTMSRNYLIIPGLQSSNFYIVDTSTNPKKPFLYKTISGKEIKSKTNLSSPHTVHCLGSEIIVSMLGDADGNAPGGFLHLNKDFEIIGRWENDMSGMNFGYDFWYQPRHNVMVSSEWGAPKTFMPGFNLDDVANNNYGRHIHFWNFEEKKITNSVDLGPEGLIPLEVRFHHNPDSSHGFVGAALSSNIFHWYKNDNGKFDVKKVIDVASIDNKILPVPMPGLITDILVSMDDRYLYFSNWLHGDLRQYDISDPFNPKLTGQVWIGGLLGKANIVNGKEVNGAPQMIQLSLDGKRLFVTTSLFSSWDNQFYPKMNSTGGMMLIVDCDNEKGGMKIRDDFLIDFGNEPNGPSRAHETRYPGGDCSSDIWV